MSREAKPSSTALSPRHSRKAELEVLTVADAVLVRVFGMLDEHFPGFGDLGSPSTVVLELSGLKFITSFGVRQWLRAMAGLPPSAHYVYVAGCPRIFVEQLNMILNFGGRAQILTLLAPYRCTGCGAETDEVIDAVADTASIVQGNLPAKACKKCGGKLSFDEMPESYFACLDKYGPTSVSPAAVELLAANTSTPRKQVAKPRVAKPATKTGTDERSSLLWWIVIGVLLAGLATGLYVLVGPA